MGWEKSSNLVVVGRGEEPVRGGGLLDGGGRVAGDGALGGEGGVAGGLDVCRTVVNHLDAGSS